MIHPGTLAELCTRKRGRPVTLCAGALPLAAACRVAGGLRCAEPVCPPRSSAMRNSGSQMGRKEALRMVAVPRARGPRARRCVRLRTWPRRYAAQAKPSSDWRKNVPDWSTPVG